MGRSGKYLKRTGRGTCPGLVVSVIVADRTVVGEESDPRCRARVFHSVSAAYSYHGRHGWTHPRTVKFGRAEDFWRWLDGLGQKGRRVYCFSPISSDSFTLLRGWDRLAIQSGCGQDGIGHDTHEMRAPNNEARITLVRLVLRGRPDVIGYTVNGCSFLWLSGRQFWDYPTRTLFDLYPPTAGGRVPGDAQSVRGVPLGTGEATTWLRAMTDFADWWRSLQAGPFPRTVPSAAMQFFRSRMVLKSIVVHRDEEAYRLERRACHGGRSSLWFAGVVIDPTGRTLLPDERPIGSCTATVDGPVYRLDVRSMYPSLLRDREYPVRLVKHSERYTVDDIQSLSKRYGVIADVQLNDITGEYPNRQGESVGYPVGVFRSVLCGPELSTALASGSVRIVYAAAVYEMGRPFATAAGELCEMRELYRRRGQKHYELLSKLLGNSLAGKLAQRPRGWKEVPGVGHHPEWDVWIDYNADTREAIHRRSIAGRVYEYRDIGVGQGCLTACFAFLTSYGRSLMRGYRELCPPRSVYAQDTDGIWVSPAGLAALHGSYVPLADASPGHLALAERIESMYWLSPKHYCTPKGWTLAGYHSPGLPRKGMVLDTYDVNPVRAGCTAPPTSVDHFVITKRLPDPPPAHLVGADGWIRPIELPEMVDREPVYGPPLPPD